MSRGRWVIVGVGVAVALGGGIRLADKALASRDSDREVEKLLNHTTRPFLVVDALQVRLYVGKVGTRAQEASTIVSAKELYRRPVDLQIPALVERLSSARRRHRTWANDTTVEVCAQKGVRFAVLKQVLYSCYVAGYERVVLRAVPKGTALPEAADDRRAGSSLAIAHEELLPCEDARRRVRVELLLGNEGIVRTAGGDRRAFPAAGWHELRLGLRELKSRLPNQENLVLFAHDEVTVGELLRAAESCHRAGLTQVRLDPKSEDGWLLGELGQGGDETLVGGGNETVWPSDWLPD
jgi:hypothetical protein